MNNRCIKKPIVAWCLYSWASDSFSIIITTFIFSTYFTTKIAGNEIIGTYQWANATSIAGIIIAIFSPLCGAIADHAGHHKRWLLAFTFMAVMGSAMLWFAYPEVTSVYYTLTWFVIGMVGLEIALVFYNAFLPKLAPKNYLGRVSGWGWGCGYLGGILALTIALIFFVKFNVFSLNTSTFEQIRICGPFVALWYGIFSLPFFFMVPSTTSHSKPFHQAIYLGVKEVWSTIKRLPSERNIFIYLIAHMVYTDGLNTLFAFGGIYAAGTYGLNFEEVLLLGISMNIAAGIGALCLAWVDDAIGSKPTILISLAFLILLAIPMLFLEQKYLFWIFALFLSLFVGPVQSASRSLMVHLIDNRTFATEMFGLYALSGRVTAFIGPWLLGMLTLSFGSQRVGMATVLVFFVLGALLLLPVHIPNKEL